MAAAISYYGYNRYNYIFDKQSFRDKVFEVAIAAVKYASIGALSALNNIKFPTSTRMGGALACAYPGCSRPVHTHIQAVFPFEFGACLDPAHHVRVTQAAVEFKNVVKVICGIYNEQFSSDAFADASDGDDDDLLNESTGYVPYTTTAVAAVAATAATATARAASTSATTASAKATAAVTTTALTDAVAGVITAAAFVAKFTADAADSAADFATKSASSAAKAALDAVVAEAILTEAIAYTAADPGLDADYNWQGDVLKRVLDAATIVVTVAPALAPGSIDAAVAADAAGGAAGGAGATVDDAADDADNIVGDAIADDGEETMFKFIYRAFTCMINKFD